VGARSPAAGTPGAATRSALASGNSAEFLVTYYACAKLGVICVPINLGWRTNEVAYVLGHSCARGIVIESQLLPVLDSALVEVPAVADVIVISYELAAAGERGTTFAQLTEGFDAGRLLELIETERITQIFGLPMMYRQMLDHPDVAGRDLSSLRRALYAMAPMPEAQLRRCLEVFGCEFYLLFGQTEMSPTATLFRPEHQLSHAGAVGTPVANVAITAVVVPRPGARIDERELIDSVKGVIDPYRAPKAVLVVDDLPKTSTGKIQKNAVRDKFAGHYTAG